MEIELIEEKKIEKSKKFEEAKQNLKKFLEKMESDIKFERVEEKESAYMFFERDHNVTGEEFNRLISKIQDHFISKNYLNKNIVREFMNVYTALDLLDEEYIQKILKTNEKIEKSQNDIRKAAENQEKMLKIIKKDLESQEKIIEKVKNEKLENTKQFSEIKICLKNVLEEQRNLNSRLEDFTEKEKELQKKYENILEKEIELKAFIKKEYFIMTILFILMIIQGIIFFKVNIK